MLFIQYFYNALWHTSYILNSWHTAWSNAYYNNFTTEKHKSLHMLFQSCCSKQKKKKSYGISDIWTTFLLVPGHCPGMGTLSGCGLTHPLLQNTRGFLPEVVDFDDIFLKIKNKCNTASFSNSISLAIHRIALKLGRHWDQCWSPKTVSNRLFWF